MKTSNITTDTTANAATEKGSKAEVVKTTGKSMLFFAVVSILVKFLFTGILLALVIGGLRSGLLMKLSDLIVPGSSARIERGMEVNFGRKSGSGSTGSDSSDSGASESKSPVGLNDRNAAPVSVSSDGVISVWGNPNATWSVDEIDGMLNSLLGE